MLFVEVYSLYIKKAVKKGRTKEEVDPVVFWLTGYDKKSLQKQIEAKSDFETFFLKALRFNPSASRITGMICGYRVEETEDDIVFLKTVNPLIDII